MSPDKKGPVFSGRAPASKKSPRVDRPLAEYKDRMAKRKARAGLRARILGSFPWFGVIGVRELGLAIIILSLASTWFWARYRMWGLVGSILGFLVMRYGEDWLKGGK